MRLFCAILISLLPALFVRNAVAGAPTGTYTEAVVQVVFSDETDSQHFSVSDLNAAASQIQTFFSDLSYGKLTLQSHFIRVHLSTTYASYGICHYCNFNTLMNDAINGAIALNSTFFAGADGVSVLVLGIYGTGNYTDFGLQTYSGLSQQVLQSLLAESSTANPIWGSWSHEFGHQLEVQGGSYLSGKWLGHPSGYASGYDLMDSCYPCGESSFGLLGSPFVVDPRTVFPGWLDSIHVATVPIPTGGPIGQTYVLPPLSQDVTTPVIQAVQIPVDANRFYWVNARQRTGDDSFQAAGRGIFTEGVQIQYTDVNATFPVTVCRPFESPTCTNSNTDPPNWPYDLWPVGTTFTDSDNNISVTVVSAVSGGYEVNITRDVPPNHPDLFITPWLTPPMNTYETVDIWVDSICNGYGVLRYGTRADGTVIGSGDDPCVNHENRVYATIHNIGSASAPATTATFQVSNPLGVGVTGSWTSLGTASVPSIPAGGSASVFVTWTPTPNLTPAQIMAQHFKFHSCVQVAVTAVPGEIVTTNNNAQENIGYFEAVAQGAPVGGNYHIPIINGAFNLTNSIPGNSQQYSLRTVSNLPAGWTYSVNGGTTVLQVNSGQTVNIPVQVTPPASPVGQIYDLKADALTILTLQDHGSTHPSWYVAGGVDLNAHTVLPSQIGVSASVNPPGNTPPAVQVQGLVTPAQAGAIVTIDLYDTANNLASAQATVQSDGHFSASMSPAFFPSSVRAIWQGNMLYSSAVAAASVETRSVSTTTLTSSLNPSIFESSVTFTATVTPSSPTPTGTVTFSDGSTVLGTSTLSGGSATLTTAALAVGTHSITAAYSGDFNYLASTSLVLTQTVQHDVISLSSTTDGAVSTVSIAQLKNDWVVTAARNGSGDLEVMTWQNSPPSAVCCSVTNTGSATGAAINNVAIADLDSSHVVTAANTTAGTLRVSVWNVSSTGAITRQGTILGIATGTQDVAITGLNGTQVVTAVTNTAGNLTLNTWKVDSLGNITAQGTITGAAGTQAVITAMTNNQVVTALRTSAGNLMLSSWGVDGSGTITHQNDASAGAISAVAITEWTAGTPAQAYCVTPVVNGSGKLQVYDWTVDPGTGAITKFSSATAGAASQVAAATLQDLLFTPIVNGSGNLQADAWQSPALKATSPLTDSSHAATAVAACPLDVSESVSVTATRNGKGNLQLNVWQFVSPE